MITLIAAIANNNALGKDNDLIWHLPADLKRFKKVTSGHHILMGRNTFESIGKPLPNRTSVIITRNNEYVKEGCLIANSVEEAIDLVDEKSAFILGGAQIYKEVLAKNLADRLYFIQNASGAICGPQDSFLVLRGIKTLHVRMQRHCENGKAIAEYLVNHPKVENVYWPGFENHPNHHIAKSQMKDFGGMITITSKGSNFEEAIKIVEKLKIFTLAESLGGVESLSGHPASMTHASIPTEERETTGVVDSFIRLSVGIEDLAVLIAALKQALG